MVKVEFQAKNTQIELWKTIFPKIGKKSCRVASLIQGSRSDVTIKLHMRAFLIKIYTGEKLLYFAPKVLNLDQNDQPCSQFRYRLSIPEYDCKISFEDLTSSTIKEIKYLMDYNESKLNYQLQYNQLDNESFGLASRKRKIEFEFDETKTNASCRNKWEKIKKARCNNI